MDLRLILNDQESHQPWGRTSVLVNEGPGSNVRLRLTRDHDSVSDLCENEESARSMNTNESPLESLVS